MKKGFIKKFVAGLVLSTTMLTTFVGANYAKEYNLANANYFSVGKIEQLCEELNVDASYRDLENSRLKHNNGEPIYVKIAKDFNEEQKAEIIKSLDYVFGIAGEFNSFYHYEIVDSFGIDKCLNKSTIEYKFSKFQTDVTGEINLKDSLVQTSSSGRLNRESVVNVNSNIELSNLYNLSVHELLHAFGIEDVYDDVDYQMNTFINVAYGYKYSMITPNDYLFMAALCAPNFENEEQKQEYIAMVKQKHDEYSKKFYLIHSKEFEERQKESLRKTGDSEEKIENSTRLEPVGETLDLTFDNKLYRVYEDKGVRIKIQDGKYTFAVLNADGEVLEKCSGSVYFVDDVVYLQNVKLSNFTLGRATYTDFRISLNANTKFYNLDDLLTRYTALGTETQIENELEK